MDKIQETIPRLKLKKVEKIVEGLTKYWPDLILTTDDFINPSMNSVIKFYERFLQEFGLKIDTLYILVNQNCLEDKQYQGIINVYILYLCVYYLIQQLDLTIKLGSFYNFINPAADMCFVTRISMISNYIHFANLMTATKIVLKREKVLEEIDSIHDLIKKMNIVKEELKITAFTQIRNADVIGYMKFNNLTLHNNLAASQIEFEELNKKIHTLNTECELLEKEYAELTNNIEKNKIQKIELESRIFIDFETLKGEVAKGKGKLYEESVLLYDCEKNFKAKTAAELELTKYCGTIKNYIECVNIPRILDKHDFIEEVRNEKEKLAKRVTNDARLIKRAEMKQRKLQEKLNHKLLACKEKYVIFGIKSYKLIKMITDKGNQLEKDYKDITQQFKQSYGVVEELKQSLRIITEYCYQYEFMIKHQNEFYEKLDISYKCAKQSMDKRAGAVIDEIRKLKMIEKREEIQICSTSDGQS